MEQNHPLVSISLLTYNAERYIENCLVSVLKQTYPHLEILVVDNASTDGTKDYLKKFQNLRKATPKTKIPELRVIFNQKNVGFAAGHNQAIKQSKGEFILCLNQNIIIIIFSHFHFKFT